MPINRLSISNLPAVHFDGMWRPLGCLPSRPEKLAAYPKFQGTDPSTWQEIDLEFYNLPILDQGMTSSCVGHGCCSGCEMSWCQSGRTLTEFSPFFLYGLVNNGQDAGASISDALDALQSVGICPKGDIPDGEMFKNQFPQSAFDDAAKYKVVKAFHCVTFKDICSAIATGFPCPLGILVGNNFPNLDSEGVAPLPGGGGGGHCLLGMGLKKSAKYGWLIKVQNSWGPRFGINGHCYLHQGHFQYMQPDAFAVQGMSTDVDPNSPPVVNS